MHIPSALRALTGQNTHRHEARAGRQRARSMIASSISSQPSFRDRFHFRLVHNEATSGQGGLGQALGGPLKEGMNYSGGRQTLPGLSSLLLVLVMSGCPKPGKVF